MGHSVDGSSGEGQRCTMHCEACGGLVRLVGHSVTLKCDNEPGLLALAQGIRSLRRESSITTFEHPDEREGRATTLLSEEDIVKGFIRTLKSSTESNLRTDWPVSLVDTLDN